MKLPRAQKSLGQHFLVSAGIIQKITDSPPDQAQAIIEVGPGPAILTPHLAQHGLPLLVVEQDRRFEEVLREKAPQAECCWADALNFDFAKECERRGWERVWLVSNLPYNISAPLFLRFIRLPMVTWMNLMFQKEVAQKMVPTDDKLSSLKVLCDNYFLTGNLGRVPPGCFRPPPRVDSQILSFERREAPSVSLSQFGPFEKFLRILFGQKRKQLKSVWRPFYRSEELDKAFTECKIDPSLRAEDLQQDQVVELFVYLTRVSP